MSMGDKSNIIDEAEAFLFTIWLDELRRTYEKEIEHTTMSFLLQSMRCRSEWHDSSMKVDDRIYLKGMFQLEVSS